MVTAALRAAADGRGQGQQNVARSPDEYSTPTPPPTQHYARRGATQENDSPDCGDDEYEEEQMSMTAGSGTGAARPAPPRRPAPPNRPGTQDSARTAPRPGTQGSVGGAASHRGRKGKLEEELSFGEQLVIETAMRFRGRSYDRRRQEELATPRRRGAQGMSGTASRELDFFMSCEKEGGKSISDDLSAQSSIRPQVTSEDSERKLQKQEVDELLDRLSKPRRQQIAHKPSSGDLSFQRSQQDESIRQREGFDLQHMVERLATPKKNYRLGPASGESVVLLHRSRCQGRPPDESRLKELSRPKRRGGSCMAWGVDWNQTDHLIRLDAYLHKTYGWQPSAATSSGCSSSQGHDQTSAKESPRVDPGELSEGYGNDVFDSETDEGSPDRTLPNIGGRFGAQMAASNDTDDTARRGGVAIRENKNKPRHF
eukprot:gnl/TRDRNA2_/TRDRNA2_187495_c0_seq1.p1 gnl/TRDRNA2_/TRDRNA2_187495_c0~~gnl/TRDRNA2_/TRDRNA2_187495_c0_seq1.p1  ORF type:complete len:456 (+),score=70.65 gnl/TRDRNA2_/TRDRNA2_187495_c0_seq1:89-1369(+)